MEAEEYDRWYATPRGRWIGRCEIDLLRGVLQPRAGESLLDVGCGTGFFTRELPGRVTGRIIGVDINHNWLRYAVQKGSSRARYALADARMLPFRENRFDLVVSIAALCFIKEPLQAICEIVRVTRRRFAIGLLNRKSLLWVQKGRKGGRGAYRGARWHTVGEARSLFRGLPVRNLVVRTAIHSPAGGAVSEIIERIIPSILPTGAFILVSGDVIRNSSACGRAVVAE
jgi:SAM-dependent methyltransferase